MRNSRFERKNRVANTIPTVSMGDLAFLLLIFVMAATMFRLDQGLQIVLPRAESAEKIWIDQAGQISINDRLVALADVENVVKATLLERPDAVVALNADARAPYGVVSDVIEELKQANAARLSFTTEHEPAPARQQAP